MAQNLNSNINVNVKASGINEVKDEIDELFSSLDEQLDIELNAELNESSMDDVVDSIENTKADIEVDTNVNIDKSIDTIESKLDQVFNSIDADRILELDNKSQLDFLNSLEKIENEYIELLNKIEQFKNNGNISFQNVQGSLRLLTNKVEEFNNKLDNSTKEYTEYIHSYEESLKKLGVTEGLMTDEEESRLNTLKEASRIQEKIKKDKQEYIYKELEKELSILEELENLSEKYEEAMSNARYTDIDIIDTDNGIDNINKYIDKLESLGDVIDNVFDGDEAVENVNGEVDEVVEALMNVNTEAKNIGSTFSNEMNIAGKSLDLFGIRIPILNKGFRQLNALIKSCGTEATAAGAAANAAIIAATAGIAAIIAVISAIIKLITIMIGYFHKADELIESTLKKVGKLSINAIKNSIQGLFNLINRGVQAVGTATMKIIGNIKNGIAGLINITTTGLKSLMSYADYDGISSIFSNISSDLQEAIGGSISESSSLMMLLTEKQRKELLALETEYERYNYILRNTGSMQAAYNSVMGSSVGQIYKMSYAFNNLISSVKQLSQGILGMLAPVLTKIITLANAAVTAIASIFGIKTTGFKSGLDSGSNNLKNYFVDIGDSASKASKKTDKAKKDITKDIKEIERKVASFDDVIQLQKDADNDYNIDIDDDTVDDIGNLGSGIGDLSDALIGLGEALNEDESAFKKWWEQFKKLLDAGQYREAGRFLDDTLTEWLDSIDWDAKKEKALKMGKDFAEFLNGIFESTENWKKKGKALAQAVNTVMTALYGFVHNFDWKQAGNAVGAGFKEMFEQLDASLIAETIHDFLYGVFDLALGFFSNRPLTSLAKKFVEIINTFIGETTGADIKTVSNAISEFLSDVFDAAIELFNIDGQSLKARVSELINNLVGDFNESGREKLINLATSIADFLIEAINSILDEADKHVDTIVDIGTILFDAILKAVSGIINPENGAKVGSILAGLFDNIGQWFEKGGRQKINETIDNIFGFFTSGIREFFENWDEEDTQNLSDFISDAIISIFRNLGSTDTSEAVLKGWESIKDVINQIITNVEVWLNSEDGQESLRNITDTILTIIGDLLGSDKDGDGINDTGLITRIQGLFLDLKDKIDYGAIREAIAEILAEIDLFSIIDQFIDDNKSAIEATSSKFFGIVLNGIKGALEESGFKEDHPILYKWLFGADNSENIANQINKDTDKIREEELKKGSILGILLGTFNGENKTALTSFASDTEEVKTGIDGINNKASELDVGKSVLDSIQYYDTLADSVGTDADSVISSLDDLIGASDDIGEIGTNTVTVKNEVYGACNDMSMSYGTLTRDVSSDTQSINKSVNSIKFDGLSNGLTNVINNIKKAFNELVSYISQIVSRISQTLSNISSKVTNFKIPGFNIAAHATGGITNGPSIGLVGEAGREAILPLENNTGWMDILANKISGINGGGGNTQNITIDFSSLNKPFYSRAELIEMGQVINDSLNAYNFGTT